MARVSLNSVWMQKHPTPAQQGGGFHWYPDTIDRTVISGVEAMELGLLQEPFSVCMVTPERLVWLRSFHARAPTEQRTYSGLAGVVAGAQTKHSWPDIVPSILTSLELPENAPWTAPARGAAGVSIETRTIDVPTAQREPLPPRIWGDTRPTIDMAKKLARVLWLGGTMNASSALDVHLPKRIGRLLAWFPREVRTRSRQAIFASGRSVSKTPATSPELENILHYLANSWVAPVVHGPQLSELAVHAWRLVDEYLEHAHLDLPALFDEFGQLTSQWTDASALQRYVLTACGIDQRDIDRIDRVAPAPLFGVEDKASHLFTRILHYWGRGFFDDIDIDRAGQTGRAGDLASRLARILTLRTVVDHLLYLEFPGQIVDPCRYLARLEYESILTTKHVEDMKTRVSSLIPSAYEHAGRRL